MPPAAAQQNRPAAEPSAKPPSAIGRAALGPALGCEKTWVGYLDRLDIVRRDDYAGAALGEMPQRVWQSGIDDRHISDGDVSTV
jgi:hypothetical protein